MAVNPLPPQAFTKETLQKAYTWLLTQSPSIKEMASTQDMLISLYLKAQRNGEASLETPSIQNFKQELKSLANIMGDLQTPQPSNSSANQNSSNSVAHHHASSAQSSLNNSSASFSASATSSSQSGQTNASAPRSSQAQVISETTTTAAMLTGLDATTLHAIHDVKQTLNLSSDAEALRALIALGHKQFRKINS